MGQQRSASHGGRRRPSPADDARTVNLPRANGGGGPLAPAPRPRSHAEGERDALMRVAAAAAAATALEDVLELTAEAAHEAMGQGSIAISRWERESALIRTIIKVGDLGPGEERFPADETYPLAEYPAAEVLMRTGAPHFIAVDDPKADPKAVDVLRSVRKESVIGVAVIVDGQVWGAIWATTDIGAPRFRARDVRFLETIAGQLAAVIDRADRFSSVSRLAYEDPLTGLANRRALDDRLERATARHRAESVPLALIVCDVDNLKEINDGRGHQAGDRALRRVGEALVAAAAPHPAALVARLSGDEFAVVLEDSPIDAAREVAATALRLLREERDVRVSLSCGAAAAAPGAQTASRLLRAADSAQYAAKRRGGDRVCTAAASTARDGSIPRRRMNRRDSAERLEQISAELLGQLDTELAGAETVDRLELVAAGFAELLNAAAWTVSFSGHGSPEIRSMCTADDRDTRLRGIRVGLDDDVYELADYPLTARHVAAGAGSFVIDRHDRGADAAERALLAELGFAAVLGAIVSDFDGVYLLELYADGDTADLAGAGLRVELLARAAAGRSAGTAQRIGQLRKRTRQLAATGALGARLACLVEPSEIVEVAVDVLHREFGSPVCAITRLTDAGRLELVDGRGEAVERVLETGWSQPATVGILGRALRDREVVVVDDVSAEPDYRATTETGDVRSELCAPLWAGDELWGAIDLEDPRQGAFDEDDVRLVTTVADQVSAALRSASLYGRLEAAYLGTAESLVAALEAKDAYTASHSRSIAANAEAVGLALGMEEAELRTLRFGAAFHDIGKLAIPEAILAKPGPLTAEERSRVEQHTLIGDQILAPIEFLADVRPLVRHGHERWDGRGYPDGLAGEAIPLGARIIFACDAYDAMTSDRPYRPALGDEVAAAELARHAGTQFDPAVVDALLSVLEESGLHRRSVAAS